MKLFVLFVGLIFPVLNANIGEWDEVWRRRAEEAWNRTLDTYDPNPENIVAHFNVNVNRALNETEDGALESNSTNETEEGELEWSSTDEMEEAVVESNSTDEIEEDVVESNSTRRQLRKKYRGPCMATNPIDRCWRCKPNWADNRYRLADCVLGFGRKTTGGKNGRFYVVTDSSDNDMVNPKPGTLRHAVIQKEPLWIIFGHSMVITLRQELIMQGDKTIDGRGVKVEIAYGAGITIQFVKNVIIHGLKIHDIVKKDGGMIRDSVDHYGFRTRSDGDGISIFGSQNVWVDHVSMTRCSDGLIDAIQGSTGITLSNNHFTDHNKTLLFGATDSFTRDEKMQITVAFNHFGKRLVQRMPRCRFGYIHVVNNDYTHWKMYAIGGSSHPTIVSQGNRYIADHPFAKQVTKREKASEEEWKKWTWISEGDLFLRGAYFVTSGDQKWTNKHPEVYDKIVAAPAKFVAEMTKFAGVIKCKVGIAC